MKTFDIIINKILGIPEIESKVDLVELYVAEGVIFCEIHETSGEPDTGAFTTDDLWEVKTENSTIPVRIVITANKGGIPLKDSIFYDAKNWMDKVKDILQFYLYDCKI